MLDAVVHLVTTINRVDHIIGLVHDFLHRTIEKIEVEQKVEVIVVVTFIVVVVRFEVRKITTIRTGQDLIEETKGRIVRLVQNQNRL